MQRRPNPLAILIVLVMFATLAFPVAPARGQTAPPPTDNWEPRYLRSIGGMGRPGVFSWGLQYNPVSDEILVGDYLHFQIRRYDRDGNYIGEFWREDACGQPYSIGVDPNDGAVYFTELKDNPLIVCVVKYDKDGNFMYSKRVRSSGFGGAIPAFYTVWLTVDDAGDVWVMDSHFTNTETNPPRMLQLRFDDATETVEVVNADADGKGWPILPEGLQVPRTYGVDITSDGILHVSDAYNARIHRYTRTGELLGSYGAGAAGFDGRGVAINEDLGRVYVVDAQYSDVDVFDLEGGYLFSFGSEGTGPGQFAGGGRQVTVDVDNNVWVANFGGFKTQKFDADGNFLLEAPVPERQPPTGLLAQPRDVSIDQLTGDVWVADTWAQRFQRFSSTGAFEGTWGHRGPGGAYDMNYPRSIAVDEQRNRVWVANERGHHIQIYDRNGNYIRQIGQIGNDDTDPGHFRWPTDIEFYGDKAVIGDRIGARVKVFDKDELGNPVTGGEVLIEDDDPDDGVDYGLPIARSNHGTAVDPDTGEIYVVNASRDRIYVYDIDNGEYLFRFGERGTGPGQFNDAVDATIVDGILYVVDEATSQVSAWDISALDRENGGTAGYLGHVGSGYGMGPYEFRNPVGIDHDSDGNIYITDSHNDRIQVFDPNMSRPSGDDMPPSVGFAVPVDGSVIPLEQTTISGTAFDSEAIASIEIAVWDPNTGLYWNSETATWTPQYKAGLAAWTSAQAPAAFVQWQWVFNGTFAGGEFLVEVKSRDHNDNVSASVVRGFAFPGGTPPDPSLLPDPDVTAPLTTVDLPTPDQVLPVGSTFTGDATDDVTGVEKIRFQIKNNTPDEDGNPDGRWLDDDGRGWSTRFDWIEADIDDIGALATDWSIPVLEDPDNPPDGWYWEQEPGDFTLLMSSVDGLGNAQLQGSGRPWIHFSLYETGDDTDPPTGTIAPLGDVPLGPVNLSGTTTDNSAVAAGELLVDGEAVAVTLDNPGAPSSIWSATWTPAAAGTYTATYTALDAAGNIDPTPAEMTFTVTEVLVDETPPDTTITDPQHQSSHTEGTLVIGGGATDDAGGSGIGAVEVSVRDASTGEWFNGTTWVGTFSRATADLSAGVGAEMTGWSLDATSFAPGTYGMLIRTTDVAGNVDPTPPPPSWRTFTISEDGGGVDTIPPNAVATTPTSNQAFPPGSIELAGTITDNVAVGTVSIAIRDRDTGQWWTGSGWNGFTWLVTSLAAPGASASTWTAQWTPPSPGNYAVLVRGTDAAGNDDPTRHWVQFTTG